MLPEIPNQTTSIKRKCSETVIVNMNSSYCITHLTNDIWFFLICVRIIMCSNPPNHHMSSNISGDHQILKIKNKIGFVCLQSRYLIFYLTFIDNQATKPSLLRVKFVEYHGFSNTPHVDTRVSSWDEFWSWQNKARGHLSTSFQIVDYFIFHQTPKQ